MTQHPLVTGFVTGDFSLGLGTVIPYCRRWREIF